jgi:AhpD family alkylhydroperoxidase
MSHARSEYENFKALAPDAYDAVMALGQVAAKAGIDKQLLELIKLRASQINGCAFCVQYHILQGERLGMSVDKLNLVVVWRETPLFSARERAALAWTEALTLLPGGVSDEVYAEASAEFSEKELMYLTSAIASINVWNRFAPAIAGLRRRGSRHRLRRREMGCRCLPHRGRRRSPAACAAACRRGRGPTCGRGADQALIGRDQVT